MPPLKKVPKGTSAIIRKRTASSNKSFKWVFAPLKLLANLVMESYAIKVTALN
jgi:hypothetical protein